MSDEMAMDERGAFEPPAVLSDRSYWVDHGVVGGAYPGDLDPGEAAIKLAELIEAGVTLFLDLTEVGELASYEPHLAEGPGGEAVRRLSLPVPDLSVAPDEVIAQALDAIDAEVQRGGVVYVHCWGGKGRTGTILGCHLARTYGDRALEVLNARRDAQVTSRRDVGIRVPETPAQRDAVRRWAASHPARPGGSAP